MSAAGRNWALIAGVSLPVVMLIGFIAYSYVARSVAEPPQYDAVFSIYAGGPDEPEHSVNLSYTVEKDQIVARASQLPPGARWTQALYRLDHASLRSQRISLTVPDEVEGYAQPVTVPELETLRVLAAARAPDGYRFRSGYDGGPGIIGMLFNPRRQGGITVEKLGVVHRVLDENGEPFTGYAQFLGWVVE